MSEPDDEELERRVLAGDAQALRELEAHWAREGLAVSDEVRRYLRCGVDECELDPHAWLGPWCLGEPLGGTPAEGFPGLAAHNVRVRCPSCFRLEHRWGPWDVSRLRPAEGFSVTHAPSAG